MSSTLKSLRVFSKKLGEVINPFSAEVASPVVANGYEVKSFGTIQGDIQWMENGWTNGNYWIDHGWSNGTIWLNHGWNHRSTWINEGWGNGTSWFNNGWANSTVCFITKAAERMGLADDSPQLQLLREFRDKLVEEDPSLRDLALEYYENTPAIVSAISTSSDKDKELDNIFHKMVEPIVNALQMGKTEEAISLYKDYYLRLKEKYVQKSDGKKVYQKA